MVHFPCGDQGRRSLRSLATWACHFRSYETRAKQVLVVSTLVVLAACADPSVLVSKAHGEASRTRPGEVGSACAPNWRTNEILEAFSLCRAEGAHARIIEVNPTGVAPLQLRLSRAVAVAPALFSPGGDLNTLPVDIESSASFANACPSHNPRFLDSVALLQFGSNDRAGRCGRYDRQVPRCAALHGARDRQALGGALRRRTCTKSLGSRRTVCAVHRLCATGSPYDGSPLPSPAQPCR